MAYDLDPAIREHYGVGVERNRLTTWGRLEAERTRELLRRYLPEPPAVVLDVGGAEGAYALPLAAAGYTSTARTSCTTRSRRPGSGRWRCSPWRASARPATPARYWTTRTRAKFCWARSAGSSPRPPSSAPPRTSWR
jgi:hypothetical protein